MISEKNKIINHPDYDIQSKNYILWNDLILGADAIEGKREYLRQSKYESDEQYNIRLWLTTYRNFALPVYSIYHSSIWRKMPRRQMESYLNEYVSNVDRLNTTANAFFKEISRMASREGLCYVLIDQSRPPANTKIETLADRKVLNIRPYFTKIPAIRVPKWGYSIEESTGVQNLEYVVIDETYVSQGGPFDKAEIKVKYKILYRNKWEIWTEGEDKELFLSEAKDYNLGEVPIVPFYFRKKKDMVGESSIASISSLCLHAHRLGSALDKSLYDTAFPLQLFKGFTKEQITEFIRSSNNGLVGDIDCDSKYIEPSGQSFEDLRKAIDQDAKDIREIALRMLRPDSKQVEAYKTKKLDQQQLDNQLVDFSYNCQEAEKECWRLFAKWINKDLVKENLEIEYIKDFDLEAIESSLLDTFQKMRMSKDLSQDTLWKIMKDGEVLPEDFDPVEEKALIAAEGMNTMVFNEPKVPIKDLKDSDE